MVGKYLFVTSWKNLSVYDIKDPMNPALLSTTPIGFMFENEDAAVSPDARYMLFSESLPGDTLNVCDLQSKTRPREIGTLETGKWADFVALDADPLADIANIKKIDSVWIAGNRVKR